MMVGITSPKCAGWENRPESSAVAGFGVDFTHPSIGSRGKSGDVTSPSTARASKGFLYNISRGGFIYLFIYLFFYIYIREMEFLF